MNALAPAHVNKPYPHQGGCAACRELKVCNYCGANIARDTGRCTNGRCTACHQAICTPGGNTSPGHGYGAVGT